MANAARLVTTRDRNVGTPVSALPKTFSAKGLVLKSSGATASDLGAIVGLPARYVITRAWVVSRSAAGTLVASVINLFTAASGGGVSVIDTTSTNATLTGLTAAEKIKVLTPLAATAPLTARRLYFRQTTDSANAGTVDVFVQVQDLGA